MITDQCVFRVIEILLAERYLCILNLKKNCKASFRFTKGKIYSQICFGVLVLIDSVKIFQSFTIQI